VYRSTFDKQVEKFVDGLGIASGLTFDSQGNLFVGDRSGIIYRVTPERNVSLFCELEPSVSAYHLALDSEDFLYVTGPTLATQDVIYRISPTAQVQAFVRGFGRPQGIAFNPEGNLQVTGSYRGRKGVYTLIGGTPELTIAAPMLVGLAYAPSGEVLYLVDNERLYRVDL
jgi:sugar lactone lactonase YvrE